MPCLTNLRVLDLGFEHREPRGTRRFCLEPASYYPALHKPFPDTLKLSLDSGLGQHKTLKKLEVVDGPSNRDREQAKKEPREYAQELKPGLVHETLFKFPGIVI
ncbi:hypothetical protein BG005_004184 [Podila minutissima]|nr:hypothetical protein BG005_004184 [Podila minutissima]